MNKRLFKERIRGSLAIILAFALILTNTNTIAFAAESQGTESGEKIITNVKEPGSSVLSQTLAVGADESDIQLPESLTVTVMEQPDTETVTEPETEEETVPETEQSEGTETEEKTSEEVTEEPAQTQSAELDEKEETIAVTWKLDESASTGDAFDASKAGNTYVYTPVIPGGYTVAEGVELPKIVVTIAASDTAFSKSEVVDGVTVTVTADEGVFPEGSTLNVRKVEEPSVVDAFESVIEEKQPETSEDAIVQEIRTEMENIAVQGLDDLGVGNQNGQELKVFDITITDKNGAEVQPDTSKGKVTVSFTGIDTDSNTDDIQVYHANEDMKDIQALETNADVDAGYAEVVAEHFSYYCLSTLKTGTQFEIKKLTSADAGKELTSGIYYVDEDLILAGADSTISGQAGGNGLKIAKGATVYLYIAEGKTLTATGGKGYAGTDGANGTTGSVKKITDTYYGVQYNGAEFLAASTGGTGGNGATGGGAAIYVPNDSKVAILGNGSLNATGGTGGNAGNGQNGQETLYYYQCWFQPRNSTVSLYSTTNNIGLKASFSGTSSYSNGKRVYTDIIIGGAGGSGGGGAAGGGAGIGSNGANGTAGATGVTGKYDEEDKEYVDKVSGNFAATNISASSSGQVYIGNVNVSATGGAGGQAGSQQSVVSKHQHSITYNDNNGNKCSDGNFWVQDGQSGGGGGAGGTGADIGAGGAGGQGGAGGDAGSCWTKAVDAQKTGYAPESVRGANGKTGTNGTESKQNMDDSQYPYNTITFTNADSNATQKYYITKQTQITVPDYTVGTGEHFAGWKVTTAAATLDASFGEQTCGLDTEGKIYQAGDTITVTGVYGNVVLEAVVETHTHDWKYEVDSTDTKKIIAYCSEEKYKEDCAYQKENALTLTLSALDTIYSGKAYTGASVEDHITSVTQETASIAYYKVDTADTTDGGTELSSAPIDAGYYYASVTLGGATAKAAFKITSFALDASGVTLENDSFERTDSEISPKVTVKVTVDGNEITLTEGKDYELSGDTSKTDVGKYTLTVTGKGNYAGTINKSWEITKQKFTVTAEIDGWTYGDTPNDPSITDNSNPGSGKVTYTYYTDEACTSMTTSKDGAASDGAAPKNAGTYYVKATVAETANYATGSGTKEFTIEKKEIGIDWSGDSFIYNGKTQEPTAIATGLEKGDTCAITVTGGQTDTNAKAGTDKYTATATAVGNANYTLPTAGTTHEFTITPAELTVTWENTELTYNGTVQAPTAALNGVMDGDTCNVTVTGGQTDANAKTNTESYEATAGIDNKNYELKDAKGTFKILPKSLSGAEVKLTPGDVVHTGSEVTQAVASVTLDNVALTASTDYEVADNDTLKATEIGVYTVTVNGIGNYTDSASAKWKIRDENPPTGQISIAENKWTSFLNNITFGHFFKETQTVTINADDVGSGVDKVYYYNSNEALQEDVVKALADDKWTEIENGGSYDIDPENNYVIYAKITDKSGNVTYISSDGFVIDKTAPKITGVKENGVYCEDVTFTATDANLDTVKVDNDIFTATDGSYNGAVSVSASSDGKHTITATDKAGNETTVHITVYNGHDWETEYTWSSDNTTCTAKATCKHDASHKETETVDTSSDVTTAADCENEGEATYKATFTKSMFTEQTKTAPVPALGHKYANPVFTWSSDFSTATVLLTCEHDASHTKTEDCTITKKPSTATCTEAGVVVHTASVTVDGQTYTDTKEEPVPATGHKYGEPVFTWSADYSSAKAVFTCENDESHKRTEECSVKKEITKQATGSEKGEITYTATVTVDGKTYEGTKKQETMIAGSEEVGSGKVTTEIIISDDMPKTEIKNLTVDTAKSLLTDAEKTQVENGAEVTIYLEANSLEESAVSTEDKSHVESQLDSIAEALVKSDEGITSTKEVETGIQYIDLSLYKKIGDGAATKLKSTGNNELEVTVDIPENLKVSASSKRTYHIVRVHITEQNATEVDILPATKSGDTLTFKTDRFSTYAIAYAQPNGTVVPTKVTLDKTNAKLTSKGSTLQLTATIEPSDATNKKVTWKSSDTSVATVDENGLVTAVGNGTATITVTTEEGGKTATVTVTVSISSGGTSGGGTGGGTTPTPSTPEQKPTSVKIDKTNETLTSKGSTTQLTATVEPSNAANKKVTWKSSDTSVATVDENGLVTAVGNGTATITATTEEGGLTAIAIVTVNISSDNNGGNTPSTPEVQKPTSVKIDKTDETLTSKGSTTQLTAIVEPSNAVNKKVTWKSSDTSVVTVDENGLVTAVGNGTATITVTTEEGGLTAIATITVNIPSDDNSGDKPSDTPKPTETPDVKDQSGLSGGAVSKLKLPILLAKGKGGDKKITLSWVSYKDADGYDCYWSYCDGKQNFKKFAGVKASKYSVTHKKLRNDREYKYFVAAYKMVDGKKVYIAKSNQLHVAMKNARKTNAKKVTVNKTNVTLKAGKTFVIKSSTKLENSKKKQLLHAKEYRYYTSNKEVAYVSKNGRVKAVKKGKCVIYVLANNGVYRKIRITVK